MDRENNGARQIRSTLIIGRYEAWIKNLIDPGTALLIVARPL